MTAGEATGEGAVGQAGQSHGSHQNEEEGQTVKAVGEQEAQTHAREGRGQPEGHRAEGGETRGIVKLRFILAHRNSFGARWNMVNGDFSRFCQRIQV